MNENGVGFFEKKQQDRAARPSIVNDIPVLGSIEHPNYSEKACRYIAARAYEIIKPKLFEEPFTEDQLRHLFQHLLAATAFTGQPRCRHCFHQDSFILLLLLMLSVSKQTAPISGVQAREHFCAIFIYMYRLFSNHEPTNSFLTRYDWEKFIQIYSYQIKMHLNWQTIEEKLNALKLPSPIWLVHQAFLHNSLLQMMLYLEAATISINVAISHNYSPSIFIEVDKTILTKLFAWQLHPPKDRRDIQEFRIVDNRLSQVLAALFSRQNITPDVKNNLHLLYEFHASQFKQYLPETAVTIDYYLKQAQPDLASVLPEENADNSKDDRTRLIKSC